MRDDEDQNEWEFKVELKTDSEPESSGSILNVSPNQVTKQPTKKAINLELDTSSLVQKPGFEVFSTTKKRIIKTPEEEAAAAEVVRADILKNRILAQFVDFAVMYLLYVLSVFELPIGMKLANIFLSHMNLKFILNTEITQYLMQLSLFTFNFFLVFVVMLSKYNKSVGKNIMGLKVVGVKADSISWNIAFQREMLFKPVSILSILGILYPFIRRNGQTLHDVLASTRVVKSK